MSTRPVSQIQAIQSRHDTTNLHSLYDVIWHSGWIFSSQSHPRPNWSGFMQQSVYKNEVEFQQSDVLLLPIIDLPPTDLTCIYSTLLFIQDQAKKMIITTPCMTFDQPLWYNASGTIAKKKLNIICHLEGLHTLMSFLGAVGDMMSGSGIEEILELVYATRKVGNLPEHLSELSEDSLENMGVQQLYRKYSRC